MSEAAAEQPADIDRTVAVIGGGLAGITAAVNLFKQGYHVTLLEKDNVLGGNYSSNATDNKGECADVYPHICGEWYKEFWHLLEVDFGLRRADLFEMRDKIKMALIYDDNRKTMRTFADVDFAELSTPTSLMNLFENMDGRILSRRDMFLFGYTYLDLVTVPRRAPLKVLDRLDVTGYLYSRPYMNENIAGLHDDILNIIWSMPSDQTSAHAYQDLLRYTLTFPHETPFAWLLKGPAGKKLMKPIEEKLRARFSHNGKSSLELSTEVTELSIDPDGTRVTLTCQQTAPQPKTYRRDFQYAVVATPCSIALKLALSAPASQSMMSLAPSLAGLREATTGRIPVVYLYFTKAFLERQGSALAALPEELIGFKRIRGYGGLYRGGDGDPDGNDYDISILDISKLWDKSDLKNVRESEPVLVLAASHASAIEVPGPGEVDDRGVAQGYAMIRRLSQYLPFINPGTAWGSDGDIDWERTRVITNSEHQLFLNSAGSESWRPYTVNGLKNIFFAGDYCRTDINMATVEAAVQSGVQAAQALQATDGRGHQIALQPHDLYANNALLVVKLLATPLAFLAALSEMAETAARSPGDALLFPSVVLVRAAAYWADWLRSATYLWQGLLGVEEYSPSGAPSVRSVAVHDHSIGLMQLALNVASAWLDQGPAIASALLCSAGDNVARVPRSGASQSTARAPATPSSRTRPPPRQSMAGNDGSWLQDNAKLNPRIQALLSQTGAKVRLAKSLGYRTYNVVRDF